MGTGTKDPEIEEGQGTRGGRRILFISPHDIFPPTSGSERRIYEITKQVSRRIPSEVSYPAEKNSQEAQHHGDLRLNPRVLHTRLQRILSPGTLPSLIGIIKRGRAATVFCHTFLTGLTGVILKTLTGVGLIVDEQNAEYLRFKSCGSRLWRAVEIYETMVCRSADLVLCVSREDRDRIIQLGVPAERVTVLDNGYEKAEFYPDSKAGDRARGELGIPEVPVALYFGNYNYHPNREALSIIEKEILPRVIKEIPEAVFVAVGRNPPTTGWKGGNLLLTGEIPRIQDAINIAEVIICPLLSGGGTRLKILESIACGKSVVSTSIGAEGLDPEILAQNLVIEDEWGSFAGRVAQLLREPGESRVPDGLAERYSWEGLVDRVLLPVIPP